MLKTCKYPVKTENETFNKLILNIKIFVHQNSHVYSPNKLLFTFISNLHTFL